VSSTTDDKHPRLTAYARFRYWVILTVASARRVLPQQEECCLSKKNAASARRMLHQQEARYM